MTRMRKEHSQPPPDALDALLEERAALGSALQDEQALKALVENLRPSDYGLTHHTWIHTAIESVTLCGGHADYLTVARVLQDHGHLQEIGSAYLVDLVNQTPTPSHHADYIRRVKKAALARRVKDACGRAAAVVGTNGADPSGVVADLWERIRDIEPRDATPERLIPCGPIEVLRRTVSTGDPIPTGLPVLDARLRGGMRTKRAMMIGGVAGEGKTSLALQIGLTAARAGVVVVCLMVDEGDEPACVRIGQQLGYIREQIEERAGDILEQIERDLAGAPLYFCDPLASLQPTIEAGAEALLTRMRTRATTTGLLVIDSIQRARTEGGTPDMSERARVELNARTARRMAIDHGIAVIYSSETNRAWSRVKREEDRPSDLTAFAEARLEYWADVCVVMRAPRQEDPYLLKVTLPKNRLGGRAPFLIRMDPARSRFEEVDEAGEEAQALQAREAAQEKVVENAKAQILRALEKTPDLTSAQLFDLVGGKKATFNEALNLVRDKGIVTWRRGEGKEHRSIFHRLAEVPKAEMVLTVLTVP